MHNLLFVLLFFFVKQKTAYEMRISDWSSDVCSSDLEKDMRDRILMLFPLLALGACGDRPADPRGVEHDETLLSVSATGRSETRRSEERRVGRECVSTCSFG